MKYKGFSYLIVMLAVPLVITGCTAMPIKSASGSDQVSHIEKPLGVADDLRFEDIPIPAGFSALRDQSFIFQDASLRVGFLRYSGRANANEVITFFKSQMTVYNWDLQNIVEHGLTTMNFIKSDETCIITIEPLATKTLINIIISPKKGSVTTGLGLTRQKF